MIRVFTDGIISELDTYDLQGHAHFSGLELVSFFFHLLNPAPERLDHRFPASYPHYNARMRQLDDALEIAPNERVGDLLRLRACTVLDLCRNGARNDGD